MSITMTQAAVNKAIQVIVEHDFGSVLRISVVGGGCSGFQYKMGVEETEPQLLDKVYEFEGYDIDDQPHKLRVLIDQASLLYLEGCEIDYVDTLESSGFKFNNPNVKTTCGCGSSFSS